MATDAAIPDAKAAPSTTLPPARLQAPSLVVFARRKDHRAPPTTPIVPFKKRKGAQAPAAATPPPREVSEYRCDPAKDTGYTRAVDGLGRFCLRFARGVCHQGPECLALHRLPTAEDEARLATDTLDIFGRPRQDEGKSVHSGSHRTLFVDITGATPLAIQELRPIIEKNFAAWGPIEFIKVLKDRAIVFVRYKYFVSACFAKEAMARQVLIGSQLKTPLFVKWAKEDTSAAALERDARERERSLAEAYAEAVNERDPEVKRRKLAALQHGPMGAAEGIAPMHHGAAAEQAKLSKHSYKVQGTGADDRPNWLEFYYGAEEQQAEEVVQQETATVELVREEGLVQGDWREAAAAAWAEAGQEEGEEAVVTGWDAAQQQQGTTNGGGEVPSLQALVCVYSDSD